MSFPSIPTPSTDLNALYQTCVALKQAVEQMTSTQQGVEHMPSIFVQTTQPDAASDGSLWLVPSGISTTLNMCVNGQWMPVGTLV